MEGCANPEILHLTEKEPSVENPIKETADSVINDDTKPNIQPLKEGEPTEANPITKDTVGSTIKEDVHPIIERKRKASEYLTNEPKKKDHQFKGYKTVICYHWENGKCKKGRFKCPFAHGDKDLKGYKYIQKDRTYDRDRVRDRDRDRDRDRGRDKFKELENTIYDNEEYIKKLERTNQTNQTYFVEYKLKLSRMEIEIKKLYKDNHNLGQQLKDKDIIIQHIVRIPQYQTTYNSQPPPSIYKPSN